MRRSPLQPRPLITPAEAMAEAARCQGCLDGECRAGCPLAVDVGAFIRRIRSGHWGGALRVLYERNPMPETCALICPVEAQCEGRCSAGEVSYPIRIAELQQAAARYGAERFRWPASTVRQAGSAAVVGGGPAGLACAAALRLAGIEVHLFERSHLLGGALARWIPTYRLPRQTLQREIQRIVDLGVIVHPRTALGRDLELDDLRDRYDAIFLGMGLSVDRQSEVPGRSGPSVLDALSMLELANAGQLRTLEEPVVVIGGGNTAIDAAVSVRHLGAREVYLVYRRSFGQMPAWPGERNRAVDTGVHVLILGRPIEYVRDAAGRLTGVRCVRTRLEPAGDGAREVPVDIPGSAFVLDAGCVVEALGQRVDAATREALRDLHWSPAGTLAVEPQTQQTSDPRIFAGGDLINGGQTAAAALADGLRAAQAMVQYIRSHRR